jgi:hypothetical protein
VTRMGLCGVGRAEVVQSGSTAEINAGSRAERIPP